MNIYRSLILFFAGVISIFILWINIFGFNYVAKNKIVYNWKISQTKSFDIVFMGDSRCTYDINPYVIQERFSNDKVINLGYSDADFSSVYYDFVSNYTKDRGSIICAINLYRFLDGFGAYRFARFYEENVNDFGAYIPRVHDFMLKFKTISTIQYDFFSLGNSHLCKNDYNYDDHRSDETYLHKMSEYQFSETRFNDFLEWIVSLKGRGINVYFFRAPTAQCIVEYEKLIKNFSYKELSKRLKEVGAIELNIENKYKTFDGSHLNCKWADIFSNDLAEELARAMNYKKAED